MEKNTISPEKIEKAIPTSELQNMINKPLHAEKDKEKETESKSNEQGKLFFDGTSETPSIYEKRLDVPAFLRKSQDR